MILRAVLPELVLAAALLVSPFVFIHLGASYDLMERVLDWGILGIGLDLLFGWTGMLSFGQAAFFGTGGIRRRLSAAEHGHHQRLVGTGHRHCGGRRGRVAGWLAGSAPHRHLLRHDHAGVRSDGILPGKQSAVGDTREERTVCLACRYPILGFGVWAQRINVGVADVLAAGGVLLRQLRARSAHRAFTVRRDPACDQGKYRACRDARACSCSLQTVGVRHSRGVCRTGGRTARRVHRASCRRTLLRWTPPASLSCRR